MLTLSMHVVCAHVCEKGNASSLPTPSDSYPVQDSDYKGSLSSVYKLHDRTSSPFSNSIMNGTAGMVIAFSQLEQTTQVKQIINRTNTLCIPSNFSSN